MKNFFKLKAAQPFFIPKKTRTLGAENWIVFLGMKLAPMGARTVFIIFFFSFLLFLPQPLQARSGDLDVSFGNAGKVSGAIGDGKSEARAIAIQRDGKIWVVGSARTRADKDFLILRFNADGSFDRTFNPLSPGPGRDAREHNIATRSSNGKLIVDVKGQDFDDIAQAIALQRDGKILVGGQAIQYIDPELQHSFHVQASVDGTLIRMNPDGRLDASFDEIGFEFSENPQPDGKIMGFLNSSVESILIGDDRIVLGGPKNMGNDTSAMSVLRLQMNGELDGRYANGGRAPMEVGSSSAVKTILRQNTGHIVAVGTATFNGSRDVVLIRFELNGTPSGNFQDEPFGENGVARVDVSGNDRNDEALAAVQQSDGKILVTGSTGSSGSTDVFVLRFLLNGSLDASFGDHGKVVFSVQQGNDQGNAITVDPAGNIWVAGSSYGRSIDAFIAVLSSNGSFNGAFGSQGKVLLDFRGEERARAIVLQGNKAIVAGSADGNAMVLRVLGFDPVNNGNPSWMDSNVGSKVSPDAITLNENVNAQMRPDVPLAPNAGSGSGHSGVVVGPNANTLINQLKQWTQKVTVAFPVGSLIQAEPSLPPSPAPSPADDAPQGSSPEILAQWLDSSFESGIENSEVIRETVAAKAIAIQADDKILVAADRHMDRATDCLLARFQAVGGFDSSFGQQGITINRLGRGDCSVADVAIQADGKIVVLGTSYNGLFERSPGDAVVLRFTAQGAADPSFGISGNGVVVVPTGISSSLGRSIALQSDGKIVVGAWASQDKPDFAVFRLKSDGNLDETFGQAGHVYISVADGNSPLGKSQSFLEKVLVQSDGKILLGGKTYPHVLAFHGMKVSLVRLMSNGALDVSFGQGGIVSLEHFENGSEFRNLEEMVLQDNGRLLISGELKQDNNISRYLGRFMATGTVDPSFGVGGFVTQVRGNALIAVKKLLVQKSNQKIILAGSQRNFTDLWRLNVNGTVDNTFGQQGELLFNMSGNNVSNRLVDVGLQSGGKMVLVGNANGNFEFARILLGDVAAIANPPAGDQGVGAGHENANPGPQVAEASPEGSADGGDVSNGVDQQGNPPQEISSTHADDTKIHSAGSDQKPQQPVADQKPSTDHSHTDTNAKDSSKGDESSSSCSLSDRVAGVGSEKYLFFFWCVAMAWIVFRTKKLRE